MRRILSVVAAIAVLAVPMNALAENPPPRALGSGLVTITFGAMALWQLDEWARDRDAPGARKHKVAAFILSMAAVTALRITLEDEPREQNFPAEMPCDQLGHVSIDPVRGRVFLSCRF